MFSCFGVRSEKPAKETLPHYEEVITRLSKKEKNILGLIYNDLVTRSNNRQIVKDSFLLFFNMTGLWGAKLFLMFDRNGSDQISLEEFLYGIARTIKAPPNEQVELLFNFFKGSNEQGIRFQEFTKMFYNYSRIELKEIIKNDKALKDQLLPDCDKAETESSTDTSLEQKRTDDLGFRLKYMSMHALVYEFARKIYNGYQLDPFKGLLTFKQFQEWVTLNPYLFDSYFSLFRENLWGFKTEEEPKYLSRKQLELEGFMIVGDNEAKKVFAILIDDTIIVTKKKAEANQPIKVIFLEGLNVMEEPFHADYGYGLSIKNDSSQSPYLEVHFFMASEELHNDWMKLLQHYEGSRLYNNYVIGEMIGNGKFSIVYRCELKGQQQSAGGETIFALKEIKKTKLTERALNFVRKQTEIMRIIDHPRIVKYVETIETKLYYYIITDCICGYQLTEYVKRNKYLSEAESAAFIYQIVKAVIYLHTLEIVHRDLKPQNIMIRTGLRYSESSIDVRTSRSVDGRKSGASEVGQSHNRWSRSTNEGQSNMDDGSPCVKIIDFGLSDHLSNLQRLTASDAYIVGTHNYIAPEIYRGEPYTFKVDNFAIGSILYFLQYVYYFRLSGRFAFVLKNTETTIQRVQNGDYCIEGDRWDYVSPEAKDLMAQLLDPNPATRIDLQEVLLHPWIKMFTKSEENAEASEIEDETLPD